MSPARRSMLLAVVFVTVWTAVEVIAAGVLTRVSPFQVVWTRYVVHLALMLLLFGWRDPARLWRTDRPAYQILRSLLMVAMPASWIFATQSGVDGGTLMGIFWLSPLLVLVLARAMLQESAPAGLWLAALVGWAGALLLLGRGPLPDSPMQLFLPLAMALSFSLYLVMTRSLRHQATLANLFYSAGGVALFLTPFMPGVWTPPAAADLLVMVAVGIAGFFSLLALDRMAAAAPVSSSAPLLYAQVLVTVGFLAAAGDGVIDGRVMLGSLLIALPALYVWSRANLLAVKSRSIASSAIAKRTSLRSLNTP